MTYLEKYLKIISNICTDKEIYCEMHHIVPKCICKLLSKSKQNLVRLTAYDHFKAHYFLWKYCREEAKNVEWEKKMWCALVKMYKHIEKNVSDNEIDKISILFQEARKNCCLCGKNNPMFKVDWRTLSTPEKIEEHNRKLKGKRSSPDTEWKTKNSYYVNGKWYSMNELYEEFKDYINHNKTKRDIVSIRSFRNRMEKYKNDINNSIFILKEIEFFRNEYKFGKTVYESQKEKMKESKRNRFWVTDGKKNLFIKIGTCIPKNFYKGKTVEQYVVYNDGKRNFQIPIGECIPKNLRKGSVPRVDLRWVITGKTVIGCWKILNEEEYIRKDGKSRPGYRCKCINCGEEKVFPRSEITRKRIGNHGH